MREALLQRSLRKLRAVDTFVILILLTVLWVNAYVRTRQIVYFIKVQFTVCKVPLNKAEETACSLIRTLCIFT